MLDYAAAVNEEIKDLFAAGADVVQIDEPWMQARPERVSGRPVMNDGGVAETKMHGGCAGY